MSVSLGAYARANGTLLPPGRLGTSGSQIVDQQGRSVRIAAIGWSGSDSRGLVPDGLWATNYTSDLDSIKNAGFNAVRLPWCDRLLTASPAAGKIDYIRNPDLRGLTSMQVLHRIVAYAGTIGLKIIFDHHNNECQGGQQTNGLWYDLGGASNGTDGEGDVGTITQERFQADWVEFARHWAGVPAVIGFDLDNEPASPATWTGTTSTSIERMAEAVGDAVERADPRVLVIVEGPQTYHPTADMPAAGPEGNLSGVAAAPVVLHVPGKVVYSVHEYPPGVRPGIYDGNEGHYITRMTDDWGYLVAKNIAPVWIGEMGSALLTKADRAWASRLVAYMNGTDASRGAPRFGRTQQGVGSGWWVFGSYPGGDPDGFNTRWGGPAKPAQKAVIDELLPTAPPH